MSRLSRLSESVHAELDDSTVERVLERRREHRNGKRRRVQWYSDGGRIDKPSQAGGRETENGTVRQPAEWSRFERVTCHIMAENVDTLDTLLDNMIVAIDHTAPNGSVIFDGYSWDYDDVAQRIPATELVFEIQWPVSDAYRGLVVITDAEETCDFE